MRGLDTSLWLLFFSARSRSALRGCLRGERNVTETGGAVDGGGRRGDRLKAKEDRRLALLFVPLPRGVPTAGREEVMVLNSL
jgi:hypothetical protein